MTPGAPVSVAAVRPVIAGGAGMWVSMVRAKGAETGPVVPAVSVTVEVSGCTPSASGGVTIDHVPPGLTAALPMTVAPS